MKMSDAYSKSSVSKILSNFDMKSIDGVKKSIDDVFTMKDICTNFKATESVIPKPFITFNVNEMRFSGNNKPLVKSVKSLGLNIKVADYMISKPFTDFNINKIPCVARSFNIFSDIEKINLSVPLKDTSSVIQSLNSAKQKAESLIYDLDSNMSFENQFKESELYNYDGNMILNPKIRKYIQNTVDTNSDIQTELLRQIYSHMIINDANKENFKITLYNLFVSYFNIIHLIGIYCIINDTNTDYIIISILSAISNLNEIYDFAYHIYETFK